ncbi:hypothetical protein KBD59_05795 [Candidatus Gracilibacteria bacterium]|nr:hypothetical protein [Candidatus Gracilibacteria bacterium]
MYFALGVLIQALLMMLSWGRPLRVTVIQFLSCLLGAGVFSIFGIPGKGGTPLHNYSISIVFLFGLFFAIAFRKYILRPITEQQLLHLTIVFVYVFIITGLVTLFPWWLLALMGIPVLGVFYEAFSSKPLRSRKLKIAAYTWHIIMSLVLLYVHFVKWIIPFFSKKAVFPYPQPAEFILEGMTFFILFLYSFYFYELIIPSPSAGAQRNRRELVDLFSKGYQKHQLLIIESLAIIIIQGGLFIANYVYHFIDDRLLVNIFLTLFPLILVVIRLTRSDRASSVELLNK